MNAASEESVGRILLAAWRGVVWRSSETRAGEPDDRVWRAVFWLCGVAAFATIWMHHYPVGVDLPQHANLFRLWYAVHFGPIEYRELYGIDWFTPYVLPYLIGGALTGPFGGLVATKCMLTLGIFGTPLMMRRWLVSIGADPRLAVFGFVIAFGFAYIWGFLSNLLALPLMLAYLAEFERQGERPSVSFDSRHLGPGVGAVLHPRHHLRSRRAGRRTSPAPSAFPLHRGEKSRPPRSHRARTGVLARAAAGGAGEHPARLVHGP